MPHRPLDYQSSPPGGERFEHAAKVGLLAGFACSPVLLGLLLILFKAEQWFAVVALAPYAVAAMAISDDFFVAMLACLLQAPLYGWLIGWILSSGRKLAGLAAILIVHSILVAVLIQLLIA